ncbi:MAG: hypothetical protein H6815_10140 [Phycisphaeraceae bacterium]|nr:hypothetical protein [Phycisphaerales bacterium]MCB9860798.1 hypothetical protein [Phycisphaeraceae bacterium]
MHFNLVDRVIELTPDSIVTHKCVSNAEEYLQDHFPGFPVLPGVLMLEAMVQAARRWYGSRFPEADRVVLGSVRALKYGTLVRPGCVIRVEVQSQSTSADSISEFKGKVIVSETGAVAASGRFSLRPMKPCVSAALS